MSKRISANLGRICLMSIVVLGLLVSLISLFWISCQGGIIIKTRNSTIVQLLKVYLPLLSLIAAFYFGEIKDHQHTLKTTAFDAFIFAIVITSIWSMAPMLLIWFGGPIEDALEVLENIKLFGDVIVLAGLGFYFSKK